MEKLMYIQSYTKYIRKTGNYDSWEVMSLQYAPLTSLPYIIYNLTGPFQPKNT